MHWFPSNSEITSVNLYDSYRMNNFHWKPLFELIRSSFESLCVMHLHFEFRTGKTDHFAISGQFPMFFSPGSGFLQQYPLKPQTEGQGPPPNFAHSILQFGLPFNQVISVSFAEKPLYT